ncbi:hypothetical protein [Streptomyces sp. NPDC029003]|uniref:hypothetical protein n=1 Tax=Streptomyces sp. NPDC029003 TaxID=3155125 RepID=UPI0033F80F8E
MQNDWSDSNPFSLGEDARRETTTFGSVDVTSAVISIKIQSKINDIARAEISINPKSSIISRLDLSGQVTITRTQGAITRPVFTGFVVDATAHLDRIDIECRSQPQFNERKVAPMSSAGVPGIELIYTLARGAGLRDDQIQAQGYSGLPTEVFEVICPVSGLSADTPIKLGHVTILPVASIDFSGLPDNGSLTEEFRNSQNYAVTYATSNTLLGAEIQALQDIDLMLSWLTVRARYSLAPLPDGTAGGWQRSNLFVGPSRGRLVYANGMRTNRRWLRVPNQEASPTSLEFSGSHSSITRPTVARDIPQNIKQAILACARAASGPDNISRVTALWEAIEFYVGQTSVPDLFSKSERRALMRSLPKFEDANKSDRVANLVASLNNPPLFVKFRHRVALDGAPITQTDIDLLSGLRKVRNDVVHGRSPVEPATHDVDHGVAIVSRILVFTMHRLSV